MARTIQPSRWGAGSAARDQLEEDLVKRDEPDKPQLWLENAGKTMEKTALPVC